MQVEEQECAKSSCSLETIILLSTIVGDTHAKIGDRHAAILYYTSAINGLDR